MIGLHQRLTELIQEDVRFELDFVTLTTGYVYRRCVVKTHSADALFVLHEREHETYIKVSEVVSARIVELHQ